MLVWLWPSKALEEFPVVDNSSSRRALDKDDGRVVHMTEWSQVRVEHWAAVDYKSLALAFQPQAIECLPKTGLSCEDQQLVAEHGPCEVWPIVSTARAFFALFR